MAVIKLDGDEQSVMVEQRACRYFRGAGFILRLGDDVLKATNNSVYYVV